MLCFAQTRVTIQRVSCTESCVCTVHSVCRIGIQDPWYIWTFSIETEVLPCSNRTRWTPEAWLVFIYVIVLAPRQISCDYQLTQARTCVVGLEISEVWNRKHDCWRHCMAHVHLEQVGFSTGIEPGPMRYESRRSRRTRSSVVGFTSEIANGPFMKTDLWTKLPYIPYILWFTPEKIRKLSEKSRAINKIIVKKARNQVSLRVSMYDVSDSISTWPWMLDNDYVCFLIVAVIIPSHLISPLVFLVSCTEAITSIIFFRWLCVPIANRDGKVQNVHIFRYLEWAALKSMIFQSHLFLLLSGRNSNIGRFFSSECLS